jgi:hypothetical protein
MIAGATTQANTPIGTVTEAQMARILFNEYCLELAGMSSCTGSDCVFVMPSASRDSVINTSAAGFEIATRSTSRG